MALDYPSGFDTPAFPAGRRIAIARFLGTAALVLFFLIICVCGLLLWTSRSTRVEPFLISIDDTTGRWTLIERSARRVLEYSPVKAMQESVAGNFAMNWFTISADMPDNEAAWQKCELAACKEIGALAHTSRECMIYCGASDKLYEHFSKTVQPEYAARSSAGEVWDVLSETMQISAQGDVSDAGSTWRIYSRVWSNISGEFTILAYVRVSRDITRYPMTMGYYVSDFSAYRLN